jgi:hypothetical protein
MSVAMGTVVLLRHGEGNAVGVVKSDGLLSACCQEGSRRRGGVQEYTGGVHRCTRSIAVIRFQEHCFCYCENRADIRLISDNITELTIFNDRNKSI